MLGKSLARHTRVNLGVRLACGSHLSFVITHDAPGTFMSITLEFLGREGLLLDHMVLPRSSEPDRGLFIGVYSSRHFADFNAFVEVVFRISAITQDWYAYGELESAYQWYTNTYDGNLSSWLKTAQRSKGSLRDWLKGHNIDVDLAHVPEQVTGELFWAGDEHEFTLVARCRDVYADIFLADRT